MHFKDVLIPYHIAHLDDAQKNKYTNISIIKIKKCEFIRIARVVIFMKRKVLDIKSFFSKKDAKTK